MKLNKYKKIFISGHNGMVGSSILRFAKKNNLAENILTINKARLDLTNKNKTYDFLKKNKPEIVFICSAKVGGILANNNNPVEFLLNNLEIQNNLISGCFNAGIKKILFLGSSCIYPRTYLNKKKSFSESDMLSNKLELTNEPYALAKISGIKLCESYNRQYNTQYRSIIPPNLYGPNDNYHPTNSHVLAALIRKFSLAKKNNLKKVTIWGSGNVKREFLHVDDLAKGAFFISSIKNRVYNQLTSPQQSFINIGYGDEISIKKLCKIICKKLKFDCKLEFDHSKPDGTKSKLINSKKMLSLGWKPEIKIEKGIELVLENYKNLNDL